MPRLVHRSALSWNDILLVPQHSEIRSRLHTDLTTRLTRNISIEAPICSTNMMTVTDVQMAKTMGELGGAGFLHRFMPYAKILEAISSLQNGFTSPIVVSVGVKAEDKTLVKEMMEFNLKPDVILIDIAHGDSVSVVDMLKYIKDTTFNVDVIAGNIATSGAAERLCDAGADALRVGVGGGSVCSTRTVTGFGVPTLQSVIDCYDVARDHDVPIIADGGFKTSGDIVKALAFGASTVSLGGILGATSDSPGSVYRKMQMVTTLI